MISFQNFTDNIQRGLLSVTKVNDAFSLSKKCFNPDTGDQLDDEVVSLDVVELTKIKDNNFVAYNQLTEVLNYLATLE